MLKPQVFAADTQAGFVFVVVGTTSVGTEVETTAAGTALFEVQRDVTSSSVACVLAMVLSLVDKLLLEMYEVAVALALCVGLAFAKFGFLLFLEIAVPQGDDSDSFVSGR